MSAYLITELLLTEKLRHGSINIGAFYIRRICRIWPLYFLVMLGGFFASHLLVGSTIPICALAAYLLLLGNWYTACHGFLLFGMGHLWSISIEEQFYLVWPSIVQYATRRTFAVLCGLAWVGSQAALIWNCGHHVPIEPAVWVNSFTQLQFFVLGAGVSVALKGSAPKIHGWTRIVMCSAALVLFFLSAFIFDAGNPRGLSSLTHTYPGYLIAGAATLLILLGFLGNSALADLNGLRYLGKISYGLYLYHLPSLMVAGRIVRHLLGRDSWLTEHSIGLMLTIGVASASYRYFESPLLRLKERFEVVKSRAV